MSERLYLIQREGAELSNPGDVYVTGPHFGGPGTGIFSSTRKVKEASRYTMEEAKDLLFFRHLWRTDNPRIVAVENAKDLPDA